MKCYCPILMQAKKMSKNIGFLVCILIMVMDIVAGILGIEAEIEQDKTKHAKMWLIECRDASDQAFKLGVAAIVILSLAHVIVHFVGGCVCLWDKKDLETASANKLLALISLVFSWIILAIAYSLLIIGIRENSRSRKSCEIEHPHMLSIGGVMCFLHGLVIVVYYVSVTAAQREDMKQSTPV